MEALSVILISLSACGQNGEQNNDRNVTKNTKMDVIDYNPELIRVHPKAKELMNEGMYQSDM